MIREAHALTLESGRRRIALRVELPPMPEGTARTWINCAIEGEWKGHPAGPFEFNQDVFKRLKANFEMDGRAKPLYFEHPRFDLGVPVPAAGWIHGLEIRPDGLWADVEFLPKAAELVRGREYLYCSVVVDFASEDRKSGEEIGPELFNIGLTNEPFLSGLQAIALSKAAARNRRKLSMENVDLESALAALGLGKDATEEEATTALCAAMKLKAAQEGTLQPEGEPGPSGDTGAPQTAEMSASYPEAKPMAADPTVPETPAGTTEGELAQKESVLAMLEKATGMDLAALEAFVKENADAIAALAGSQPSSGTQAEQQSQQASMSINALALSAAKARIDAQAKALEDMTAKVAELTELSRKAVERTVESRVDDAVKAGHILDADREKFVKLANASREMFDEFLNDAAKSPVVPVGTMTAAPPTATTDFKITPRDETEERIVKQLGRKAKPETIELALRKYRDAIDVQLNGRA